MKHLRLLLLAIILLSFGYQHDTQSQDPIDTYANPVLWYKDVNTAGRQPVDVFYMLPTTTLQRVNAAGDTVYYADPYSQTDRAMMQPSYEIAEQIFGQGFNFYAPYYSQLTIESWRSDELVQSRFGHTFVDVKQAFDYYYENINNGRPFILAGFSQGGKCIVELLKTLTDDQCKQLVAAYVVGYKITASDTTNYSQIKPAQGKSDIGVAICYNSVATVDAICSTLHPSAVCINPINWTRTDKVAQLNDTVTVHVNNTENVLIVDGVDPEYCYRQELGFLFKLGNYHVIELEFYGQYLSENLLTRVEAYNSKR